ncbi:translation elongation factor Ts [Cognatiluteimonas profundi]|uniref:translation elongation factor Ts n=1 Tax=Cognatiluteimonas profundi TaxID=2594501 RepID=UPI00131D90FF|nr:translation elongation factor Ts [Lysobacter profundi]
MAEITATLVKELRERTGAGMMECKKALVENAADIEAAADWLRKTGLAKADKKASRVAAEGRIAMAQSGNNAVIVEINSETDFVAKDAGFLAFSDAVAQAALQVDDIDALKVAKLDGGSVEDLRSALIAKVGENVQVRRMARMQSDNTIGAYVHGGRIGVLIEVKGGTPELARGLAMHIAAMNPPYISPAHVPADFVAREKEIALAQVRDSGKPAEILEKMISGKVAKTVSEITLTGQPYVMDTNQTVEAALKAAGGAQVLSFVRLAVGEGIEKQADDFAAEVMKQAGLA